MHIWARMIVVVGLAATPVWAQSEAQSNDSPAERRPARARPQRASEGTRDIQGGVRNTPRGEWADGSGGELLKRLHALKDEMGLTAEQAENYDKLLARYESRLVERKGRGAGADGEQRLRRARRPNEADFDNSELALTRRVAALRSRQTTLDQFFGEVSETLDDGQRDTFEHARKELRLPTSTEALRIMAALPMMEQELGLEGSAAEEFARLRGELERDLRSRTSTSMDPAKQEELLAKLREAAEAGDENAIREMGNQYGTQRTSGADVMERFVAQLSPFLTEEQKDIVADYNDQVAAGSGSLGGASTPTDVRNIIRAAKRCELSRGQDRELRLIEREAARRVRKDREDAVSVAEDIRVQIEEMLDDEQIADFRAALAEMEDPQSRRGSAAERRKAERAKPAEADPEPEPAEPAEQPVGETGEQP